MVWVVFVAWSMDWVRIKHRKRLKSYESMFHLWMWADCNSESKNFSTQFNRTNENPQIVMRVSDLMRVSSALRFFTRSFLFYYYLKCKIKHCTHTVRIEWKMKNISAKNEIPELCKRRLKSFFFVFSSKGFLSLVLVLDRFL